MRAIKIAPLVLLTAAAACAKPVPLTSDLRQEMGAAGSDLTSLRLRIIGTFELRTSGRTTVVVKNYAEPFGATAPDDTTIVLSVRGAQIAGQADTLRLTFALSRGGASGAYTLRQINDTWIGGSIPLGGTVYQYHPCYQNVGSKCDDPIPTGAREDRQVRMGVIR